MATLIDRSRPNITVTNTATETPMYTVTIPGGTLGTAGVVYALLVGVKLKNGGGSDGSMVMSVYLDTTLIGTLHPDNVTADSAQFVSLRAEVYLVASGATGAQSCHFILSGSTSASAGDPGWLKQLHKAVTKDSTGPLVLEFRWTQTAVSQHAYTSESGVVMAL